MCIDMTMLYRIIHNCDLNNSLTMWICEVSLIRSTQSLEYHVKNDENTPSLVIKMFHNFTFFEIKNAWSLIRSDLGHNEEIKIFSVDYSLFWGCPAPPPKFDIFGRGEIFLTSAISP